MLFIRTTPDISSSNAMSETRKTEDGNVNACITFLCETVTDTEDKERKTTCLTSSVKMTRLRNAKGELMSDISEDKEINKLDNVLINEIKNNYPDGTLILSATGSKDSYSATIRLKSTSKEEFKLWLEEHQRLSGVVYRLRNIKPRRGKVVLYKCVYRCQHNTYPKRQRIAKKLSKKHTGCEAKMSVTIKAPVLHRRVRSLDSLRKEYPTIVYIDHKHNHSIAPLEDLKHKSPSKAGKINNQTIVLPAESQIKSDKWCSLFPEKDRLPNFSELQQQTLELAILETQEKETWNECERKLNKAIDILKLGFLQNPIEYAKAINKFYSTLTNLKSKTEIISALQSFGSTPVKELSTRKCSTKSPIHSSASAQLSESHHISSNTVFTEEHGYSKRKCTSSGEVMETFFKAPNTLQECVERIIL